MKRYVRMLLMPAIALIIAYLLYFTGGGEMREVSQIILAMDTEIHMKAFTGSENVLVYAPRAVKKRIAELVGTFNLYDNESVISGVNRAAGGEPVKVPEEFIRCLERAKEIGKISGGTMDVTIRPLLDAWKKASAEGRIPSEAERRAALELAGLGKIEINRRESTVRLAVKGMELDLGAIAKGFIVDECIGVLKGLKVESALIEAGGDLFALGPLPDGEPWAIGIRDPLSDNPKSRILTVYISNKAVATSGNYERGFNAGGRRYSHIIDPRWPCMSAEAVPQVTIIAPDCTTADGLATAISVLGVEEGLKLVEGIAGVEALLVTVEDGKMLLHRSSGFDKFEKK